MGELDAQMDAKGKTHPTPSFVPASSAESACSVRYRVERNRHYSKGTPETTQTPKIATGRISEPAGRSIKRLGLLSIAKALDECQFADTRWRVEAGKRTGHATHDCWDSPEKNEKTNQPSLFGCVVD
jgi:hypothetical protein